MKKLNILFITNNYTPYSGGVVSSITATEHALHEKGHKVFIVAPNFLGNHPDDPYNVFRVPSVMRFTYKKNPMAVPWRASYHIQKLIMQLKPDVIHVHHPFLLGKVALKLAKKNKISIVFTHHTMYDRYLHYLLLPSFITRFFVNRIVRNFCNAVDGVIAPSTTIKQILVDRGVGRPIAVIPSALQSIFVAQQPYIKQHTQGEPFALLVVTRFRKEKNVPFVLDVFKELEGNFTLTLAGYGQEYKRLQNYAYNRLQLPRDKVMFVHRPRKETLRDLYLDSDLFLFSSTTDTQGLVLAEAMASSTPVVAVDGPGQRDIIKQGVNGFIVADKDEMKQKIQEVARDQKLYETLQRGAFETAQQYRSELLIKKLLTFYSQIMKSNSTE